ncbi:ArsS family sensor histidine kinase [Helicobacter fennelliae]|nr:ArsS family sensor histidine kinase [Helicobacter fennelliae]
MKHSIFFKITILFLFAMGSFFAFSFYFLKFQGERYSNINEEQKYEKTSMIFNKIISQDSTLETIQTYLKEMGFIQVNDERLTKLLLEKSNLNLNVDGIFLKPIEINNDVFILLASYHEVFLYKDSLKTFYVDYYFIILIGSLILVFLFVLVMRSLLPMIYLRRQIRKFAKGDLQIECKLPQKDEIGELANEFDKAIKRIDALNKSRTLFLRSIMHELKTPITKGRIAAEMLDNKTQKERLTSVFYRLNTLIDEFAKIEQLSSKCYNITKREFLVEELIDYVKKMLLINTIEQDPITTKTSHDLIKADFELFAMSVKNLIDNAIKYSYDGKVVIDSDGKNLIISNCGNPLKMDIEEYFKPYFKDSIKPNSQGFGLGMYIIKNTLDAQGFNILYSHRNETNYFVIENCIVESSCLLPLGNTTKE